MNSTAVGTLAERMTSGTVRIAASRSGKGTSSEILAFGSGSRRSVARDDVSVREDDRERAHVVARDAVLDGAHPAGVRRDVAADGGGLLPGVRGVEESALLDVLGDVHEQHTRLDGERHVPLVQLQDVRHAACVEEDSALQGDGPADEPRAAAAHRHRDAVFVRIAHHRGDLLDGEDLHARVWARERAAQFVVAVVLADRVARGHALIAADRLQEREVVAVETLVAHFASFFALTRAMSSGTIV